MPLPPPPPLPPLRQCSSSLQAIADVAASIKAGYYDVGVAAGVETMTRNPMPMKAIDTPLQGTYYTDGVIPPRFAGQEKAAGILLNMVMTSETVAERFNVSRQTQVGATAPRHGWGACLSAFLPAPAFLSRLPAALIHPATE